MSAFLSIAARTLLLAAWAAAAIAQEPLTVYGLNVPAQVAGIPRGQVHDLEKTHPGLGHAFGYGPQGGGINVYIYTLNLRAIPDDPASDVVKNQLEQAKGDVFEMGRRGHYSNVAVKGDFTVNDPSGKTRFVCSALGFVHMGAGVAVDSYACLTSWKDKFIKIRVTKPQNPASMAEARRFVEGWIPVLWPQ
jgi:hypothetical protein